MITRHAVYARTEPTTASYIPKKFLVKRQDPPPTTAADPAAPTETPPQTTAAEDPAAPSDIPTESASWSGSEVPPEQGCTAPPQELQPYGTIVANDPGGPWYPAAPCKKEDGLGAEYRVKQGQTCITLLKDAEEGASEIEGELVRLEMKDFLAANRIIDPLCSNLFINELVCIPGIAKLPEEMTKFIEPPPPPVETPSPTTTEGENPGETAVSSEGAVPEETPNPGDGEYGEGQNGEGQNGEGQNGEGQNGEGEQTQPDGQAEQEQAQQKRYAPTRTFTYEGRSYGFQTVRRDLAHDVHTNSDLPLQPYRALPFEGAPEALPSHDLLPRDAEENASRRLSPHVIGGIVGGILIMIMVMAGLTWMGRRQNRKIVERRREEYEARNNPNGVQPST